MTWRPSTLRGSWTASSATSALLAFALLVLSSCAFKCSWPARGQCSVSAMHLSAIRLKRRFHANCVEPPFAYPLVCFVSLHLSLFRLVSLHLHSFFLVCFVPPCPFSPTSSFFAVLYPPLSHPSSSLPFLPSDACFIFATTVTRALHNETFQETVPKQDELVLYDWR